MRMTIETRKKREVVDITDKVQSELRQASSARNGFCHLSLLHTTAALTTADLDPGTDLDLLDAFEHMVPKLRYRHPHDPSHVGDHIMSALIGTSISIPVEQGEFVLGTWQRIALIELDGPRRREIVAGFSPTQG